MNEPNPESIVEQLDDKARIQAALRRATREALLMHARAGNPVSTWKDGQVVWLQPAEVFALLQEQDRQASPTADRRTTETSATA
jgi:hypothetical protein